MAKTFFTNGTMQAADCLLYLQRDLRLLQQWYVDGRHYERTCEAWLREFDHNKRRVWPILRRVYGAYGC